jgi:hypothetical protein
MRKFLILLGLISSIYANDNLILENPTNKYLLHISYICTDSEDNITAFINDKQYSLYANQCIRINKVTEKLFFFVDKNYTLKYISNFDRIFLRSDNKYVFQNIVSEVGKKNIYKDNCLAVPENDNTEIKIFFNKKNQMSFTLTPNVSNIEIGIYNPQKNLCEFK